jgi:hypothetical protein
MNLAPIILFVYSRPSHTEKALEALSRNAEAKDSILYIYADGPKEAVCAKELEKIKRTREIIRQKKWCGEVHLIESSVNKGLANSVIDGTTEIVNKFGSVITLEDDVVVSNLFLEYMNEGLKRYAEEEKVYMIAGYNFPIPGIKPANRSFFGPLTTTQAWGTWSRAWKYFDPHASGYAELKTNSNLRCKFNLDDCFDYTSMLIAQMETNTISSWAIRWWWTVFKRKGLVLFPDKSLVKNIGWDGSGRHSGDNNPYEDFEWNSRYGIKKFPLKVKVSTKRFNQLKNYLKKKKPSKKDSLFSNLPRKVLNRILKSKI